MSDTLQNMPIDTVYVQAQRVEFSQLGRVKLDLQSTQSSQNLQNALASNAVFLKQYGISGSSTVSRRGADAAQTQVLWNGLPVNNPMHGMTDFNNISTFGLQEAFLIEGGNAALFGSGSVGGTVFLRNKLKFNEGFHAMASASLSQFDNNNASFDIQFSGKTHYFQTSWAQLNFKNRFTFDDAILNQSRVAENANLFQNTFRSVYGFKSQNHELKTVVEYVNNHRGLGQQLGSYLKLGSQKDENIRSVVEYQYNSGKWLFVNRLGYVQDLIKYYENPTKADSSIARTPYFQAEIYKNWSGIRWLLGFDAQQQNAFSINYGALNVKRLYASAFASATFKVKSTDINVNARHEFYEQLPTFGLSASIPVKKLFQIKANLHSTFRRPTLNDLFWTTNSTTTTKSERGWGMELGLSKVFSGKSIDFQAEMTGYYRELNSPIIWVPNGWSWIATNFYKGQYSGIQYQLNVSKSIGKQKFVLSSGGEWVHTKIQKQPESPIYSQIFIPDFMGFIATSLESKNWSVKIDLLHTGNRFIQTDNQAWISGYRMVNLYAKIKTISLLSLKNKRKFNIDFILELRNLTNSVYENMPGRPMPGRSFWLTINVLI